MLSICGFFLGAPGEPVGDLGALLQQRLNEADNDPMAPPYDELRLYAYEGGGDTPVDLSEIEDNEDEDINFDYLHSWGPRFEVKQLPVHKWSIFKKNSIISSTKN